ncbi:MAG: alpha/beta hydrolase [Litoreibacter sp.]|nr:alpha/beta hydrolase [Litoreibacter sp.]
MSTDDRLTHMVYEASLDNTLLPELILALTEQVQIAADGRLLEAPDPQDGNSKNPSQQTMNDLVVHFRRALEISEKMVVLQEKSSDLEAVLSTLSVGVALLDEEGMPIISNRAMRDTGLALDQTTPPLLSPPDEALDGGEKPLSHWVAKTNAVERPQSLIVGRSDEQFTLLPRVEAARMGFPAKAAAVLVSSAVNKNEGLHALAATHGLSLREQALVRALVRAGDLRSAAEEIGVSYESGRTYLKRVFEKTGHNSQAALLNALSQNPLAAFRARETSDEEKYQVRQLLTLRDGRKLEYFILGPEEGKPVLLFDALSGSSIDLIGWPRQYMEHLQVYGVRLVMPCRPGIYRSDFKQHSSLRDFAPDVEELIEHLGFDQVALMSFSFGSGVALATAKELPDRVTKVILSSPSFPVYKHENWRELDQFYHLSAVLARRWPAMFRQLIPFIVHSIIQNAAAYMERYCKRTNSEDDKRILLNPTIGFRSGKMLQERTARGLKGMVEENLLNTRGWDFDPATISCPVEIYHGRVDNVAPFEGGQLLSQHLPKATFTLFEDKGHYHHIENWPWMVARAAGCDVAPGDRTYDIPQLQL